MFEDIIEQHAAKGLLQAAVADGPVHAYLFHGPPGVGKRRAALAFAGELLGDPDRVARRAHPDLYLLEPLGEQIRIDPIRELRRDLHMRPFEADRRAYLILGAHLMNEDAADALLKDLEEPPPYATILLVADELGPLPETIRSRCQLVPFSRLTRGAVKSHLASRGLTGEELEIATRVAAGRLDRADRLRDEDAKERRRAVLDLARSVYTDPAFEPSVGAKAVAALAFERAGKAKAAVEKEAADALEKLPKRELEQRARRAERGAEREEVLHALDTLGSWYRDLVVVCAGAEGAALNVDRLRELSEDAGPELAERAGRAAETVREVWRSFEFQVQTGLALEALFVRLRRDLVAPPGAA